MIFLRFLKEIRRIFFSEYIYLGFLFPYFCENNEISNSFFNKKYMACVYSVFIHENIILRTLSQVSITIIDTKDEYKRVSVDRTV